MRPLVAKRLTTMLPLKPCFPPSLEFWLTQKFYREGRENSRLNAQKVRKYSEELRAYPASENEN